MLPQGCLQAAEGRTVGVNYDSDEHDFGLPLGTQVIIASYKFVCCGNITEWHTALDTENEDGYYTTSFQVWRPSPTAQENGCYSMVGENKFNSISVDDDAAEVHATPEPSNIITVQPDDVVGYYVEFKGDIDENSGVLLDTRFSTDVVWYHTGTDTDPIIFGRPQCPFPVGTGSDGSLKSSTNAAPLLSVSVCK